MNFRANIIALTFVAVIPASPAVAQQPCNPVIDGTYCATNMTRRVDTSPTRLDPLRNLGEDILMGQDQPATIGGITFRGSGTRCMGLLRRGNCY